jgi:cytochrome c556
MKRLVCMASVMAVLAASAFATGRARAFDDETPTIKDVMGKLHKGANSPLAQLKKSFQDGSPKWKDVQGLTKEFATLGAALPKDEAPLGEKDDYKKLATAYSDNAKALDDAAKKEDLAGAQAAFGKISTSCMPCHKTHRPR